MTISEVIACHRFIATTLVDYPVGGRCTCDTLTFYVNYRDWCEHMSQNVKVESLAPRIRNLRLFTEDAVVAILDAV